MGGHCTDAGADGPRHVTAPGKEGCWAPPGAVGTALASGEGAGGPGRSHASGPAGTEKTPALPLPCPCPPGPCPARSSPPRPSTPASRGAPCPPQPPAPSPWPCRWRRGWLRQREGRRKRASAKKACREGRAKPAKQAHDRRTARQIAPAAGALHSTTWAAHAGEASASSLHTSRQSPWQAAGPCSTKHTGAVHCGTHLGTCPRSRTPPPPTGTAAATSGTSAARGAGPAPHVMPAAGQPPGVSTAWPAWQPANTDTPTRSLEQVQTLMLTLR